MSSCASSSSCSSITSPRPSQGSPPKGLSSDSRRATIMSGSKSITRITESGMGVKTRARKINACLPCRWRKKKCDKVPGVCGTCRRDGRRNPEIICQWADNEKLPELKERVNSAQESFARGFHDATNLQDYPVLNPLVANDAVYGDDADDDLADAGIHLGKLRISDRIGGLVRPEMMDRGLAMSGGDYPTSMPHTLPPCTSTMSFHEPSPAHTAPSSAMLFPASSHPDNDCRNLLPDYANAQKILKHYWSRVHPIACVVHKPSFNLRWQTFWGTLQAGQENEVSLQAIIFAVLFSGLMSMSEDLITLELGGNRSAWVCTLHSGVGFALTRANWIRSTRLETLQAVVIYLIPLCRAEVSRAHANFVAAAIRAAEGMGLYVDGTSRNYSPLQTHVRRLLWHQLGLLDIRTCEAVGPMPQIRAGESGTQLPANINEIDIGRSLGEATTWTDLTVTIIRIRCNEFIREIWTERRLLQNKTVTITDVLLKIAAFTEQMEDSYDRMIDEADPIQKYGRLIIDIQISRTYAMVLHQYHLHREYQMSQPLMKIFIEMGVKTMAKVEQFETDQDLSPWQWYAGAIQQHHYALAMAVELLLHPNRAQAPDILRGLDYVFEPPMNLRPLQRVRWIVQTMRDRMKIYVEARRLRAPVAVKDDLRSSERPDSTEESESDAEYEPTRYEVHRDSLQRKTMRNEFDSGMATIPDSEALQVPDYHHPGPSEMQPPQAETMDVDWAAMPSHFHDMMGNDINMNEVQWDVLTNTQAYDTALSQYNHVPLSCDLSTGYNYYSAPVTNRNNLQHNQIGLESLALQQHPYPDMSESFRKPKMPGRSQPQASVAYAYNGSFFQ